MKKFSKINENNKRTWKVSANLQFDIEASNKGEAAYIADSILSSLEDRTDHNITSIESPIMESKKIHINGFGYYWNEEKQKLYEDEDCTNEIDIHKQLTSNERKQLFDEIKYKK